MSVRSSIIREADEIKLERQVVSPRSFLGNIWDSFQKPVIPLIFACIAFPIIIWVPALFFIATIIYFVLQLAVNIKPDVLPIHLPLGAGKEDLHDPKPGGKGWYLARGSFYIGYCRITNSEIWANFKALTQHFLIFGTTGAGKTESIVSYIANYLSVGSGVAFQDAKAAPKAMFQVATFCRIFGRDFSFRVTNYIKSQNPEDIDPASRSSNDAGIFARGTPDSNTQLLVSLMPPSGSDNAIFAEKAIALVSAIMPGLNDLRNQGKVQIDPSIIRRHMGFKEFVSLCHNNFISKTSRDALVGYLESLAGYDDKKPIDKQHEEVTRQFGFAQAYFTRALASLSDTYGHIYLTGQGEIDYQDAVLNGRILMTLLPSMSKSGEELANLGKIVLTATRNGMVVGLGTVFEGSAERVVHNLPTNSDIPYGVMNDENAYMLVEGQEMINAQARGLGFGVLTGTQDVSGMLLSIEKTTKQIMANSAFKQIMFLDDEDTTNLACELSGEASVLTRGNYQIEGSVGNVYASGNISMEKRYRLNATAIKKQELGQAFIMYQGRIHETQVFNHGIQEKHADPRMCYLKNWWPVRMAKIHVPSAEELAKIISIDPLPEWIELSEMVSDESRALLSEMTIYFGSMISMAKIQARVAADPRLAIFHEQGASQVKAKSPLTILDDISDSSKGAQQKDMMTGVLSIIHEASVTTPREVVEVFIKLAADRDAPDRQIRIAAGKTGIEGFLDGNDGLPFVPNDDDSGRGTGSGGGAHMHEQAPESVDSMLDAWLDGPGDASHSIGLLNDPTSPPPHIVEPEISYVADDDDMPYQDDQFADEVPSAFASRADKSEMAMVVERNLMLMPWMNNVVDYSATRNNLVEIETYLNGDDEDSAIEAVDQSMEILANKMEYPTTPMDDLKIPNLTLIRSLLDKPS